MRLGLALFIALVLAPSIAAAQDVRYNFDKSANFAQFKTYAWVTLKDAAKLPELADKQVKDAIDAELAKKGLSKVASADKADLLVGYQAGIGQEKQMTTYSTGPYGYGWRGGYGGSTMTTGQTSTVYIGQIVVDMYHGAEQDLVWRGSATKTIDTKAKPDKQQKNLAKAMAKLLKNYPPPAEK